MAAISLCSDSRFSENRLLIKYEGVPTNNYTSDNGNHIPGAARGRKVAVPAISLDILRGGRRGALRINVVIIRWGVARHD